MGLVELVVVLNMGGSCGKTMAVVNIMVSQFVAYLVLYHNLKPFLET